MSGRVIVTDAGFRAPETDEAFVPAAALEEGAGPVRVDLGPGADVQALVPHFGRIAAIRVAFPVFSDGRGLTLARELRRLGYAGRLRAAGHLISDQYPMARACGFDEVEIGADLARRQPESDWLAAARSRPGYLDRLRAVARG